MSEKLRSSWPNFISNPPGSTHSTTPCSGHQTVHKGKCTMQSTDTHYTNNNDHTLHCTLLHTVQCMIRNARHCTLHNTSHCTMYTAQCAVHTAHWKILIPRMKDDKSNFCEFRPNGGKRWVETQDFPNIWQRTMCWVVEKIILICFINFFLLTGPLGHFSHRVDMSVCVCLCPF